MSTPPHNPSEGWPPQDPHDSASADGGPVQPPHPDGSGGPFGNTGAAPGPYEGGGAYGSSAPYGGSWPPGGAGAPAPGDAQPSYGPGSYEPGAYGPGPYGQQPYGPPPQGTHGFGPGYGVYGSAGPMPSPGVDPRGRPLPDPRDKYSKGIWGQPDSLPGRFRWWDLFPTVPYLGVMVVLPLLVTALMGPSTSEAADLMEMDRTDWVLEFAFNAVLFVILFGLSIGVSGKALWRSMRTFSHHALAWLKLIAVPALWVVVLVINAVLMALLMLIFGSEPETSANQAGVEEMVAAVPFWLALLVFGLLGPYVEEYFFRHLLVGKLSRHLNIWVCAVISILPFAFVHVAEELVSGELQLVLATVLPYLTMSVVFTLAYIFSGRSLMFAGLLHAFNNSMALVLQTFVLPHIPDEMEPAPAVHAAVEAFLPLLGVFFPEFALTLR